MSCQPSGSEHEVTNICVCPIELTPEAGVFTPLFGDVLTVQLPNDVGPAVNPGSSEAATIIDQVRPAIDDFGVTAQGSCFPVMNSVPFATSVRGVVTLQSRVASGESS